MVRKCQRQHQLIVSSWHGLALLAAVESAPFDFPAFEAHSVCHQHPTFGKSPKRSPHAVTKTPQKNARRHRLDVPLSTRSTTAKERFVFGRQRNGSLLV
jgi:hypothetical protein